MEATEKSWSVETTGPRNVVRGVIAAIVTAISAAYGLLLMRPELMRAAEPTLFAWGLKPAWVLTLTAAVSIVGAGALFWIVLARIARGVQRAPYVWSAPVVVGIAGIALARTPVSLPIPGVPVPLFAACASVLMLVGGALLQLRGLSAKLAGGIVLSLPLLSVASADSLTPHGTLAAWAGSAGQGRGFMLVLCATWLCILALAWIARAPSEAPEEFAPELRDPFGGGAWGPGRTRPELMLGALALVLFATLAGAYSAVYLPLIQRVQAQQSMLNDSAVQQRAAVARVREQFERELASLNSALEQERTRQRSAPVVAHVADVAPAVVASAMPPPTPDRAVGSRAKEAQPRARTTVRAAVVKKAVRAKRAARAVRPARESTRRARPALASPAGPVADDDDPIGGLDSL